MGHAPAGTVVLTAKQRCCSSAATVETALFMLIGPTNVKCATLVQVRSHDDNGYATVARPWRQTVVQQSEQSCSRLLGAEGCWYALCCIHERQAHALLPWTFIFVLCYPTSFSLIAFCLLSYFVIFSCCPPGPGRGEPGDGTGAYRRCLC